MDWRPPTLRDTRTAAPRSAAPESAARRPAVDPPADPEADALFATARDPHADNPTVSCGCGRRQSADMLRDLRALPPTLRAPFGGRAFACDACIERLRLRGVLRMSDFVAALGAPPDHVADLRARERIRDPLLPPLPDEASHG